MTTFLAVMAGGALGALLRHGATLWTSGRLGTGFPWGTLGVNILGCFLLGLLAIAFLRFEVTPTFRLFLTTGLLGGFTTFSAFSLESVQLWQNGAPGLAVAYVLASVLLGIAALLLAWLFFSFLQA